MKVLRIKRSLYDRGVKTTDEQVRGWDWEAVWMRIAVHLRNFLVKRVSE